ncbi:uncharacterized protein LOC106656877 [Trichogramma pretiosum]|uniref:Mitochondrial cytochrome c oxidase subunit VIc/VIIs domain-containing protein n=1 Tax=Trichogramma kaykai TaxID=54128 RepID=A0ABD2VZX4_9HYME|nr:uncharacterized protein LOC106656877 [Trichogramma pretiosum]
MGKCELKKPQLKRLWLRSFRIHFPISFAVAAASGILFKVFVMDYHERIMRDYYLDYDPEVSLEFMKKHMQSFGNWNPK